jgi:hypothetical protein
LAEATQLSRFASWVSSIPVIAPHPLSASVLEADHPPIPLPKARCK